MKNVTYVSSGKLGCQCDAEVIICLDNALTASGAPFIDATLLQTAESLGACDTALYNYYLEYDETLLADPTYSLVNADIDGVVCRGCLTAYIDWLFNQRNPQ